MLDKTELFIFDWSGVISDDRKPVYEAGMLVLKAYRKPIMGYEEWLDISAINHLEFCKQQGIVENSEILNSLYKENIKKLIKSGIKPEIYDGAEETLKYLHNKNKILGVLSGHPKEFLINEAEQYGVANFFNFIEGGCRNKTEGLENIFEKNNIKKEDSVYIADTIYDARHAKEARVKFIGICNGYHKKEIFKKNI